MSLKLEVGKEYVTRNGRRAKIVGHEPLAVSQEFVGFVFDQNPEGHVARPEAWNTRGIYRPFEYGESVMDLVGEYAAVRPRLLGWVNTEEPPAHLRGPALGITRLVPAGQEPVSVFGGGTWARAPWIDEPVSAFVEDK